MSEEEKTIKIKKSDLWKYSAFVLIAVLIIVGFFAYSGKILGTGNNSGTGGNEVVQQPDTQPSVVKASVDDDAALGDKNAPVTIIEFSDYQCPFCRKFWTETLPSIKSQYIDTGKVKFVYRDFPLTSLHPMATPAAEAAECARDLYGGDSAYFKMHDKIFEEQNILDGGNAKTGPVKSTVTFTNNDLKSWAKELGYNIDSCLDSGKFRSEVQNDLSDATSAGGQGTPYFVIMKSGENSGVPLSGAYPFSAFRQIIESELA